MQKNLGGDRIGSGAKIKVDMHNWGRSTFNQSRKWKSTMGVGVGTPCIMELGTNGTTFEIDIKTGGYTVPTVGPLFGEYKLQIDLFACPIRLYQGILHNNAVNIGLKMQQVLFPNITLGATNNKKNATNPSSLLNYLGIKGYHSNKRNFNAIPILAYYDIYKNYYANKQEENAKVIGVQTKYNIPLPTTTIIHDTIVSNTPAVYTLQYSRTDGNKNRYVINNSQELKGGDKLHFKFNKQINWEYIENITIQTELTDFIAKKNNTKQLIIKEDTNNYISGYANLEENQIEIKILGLPIETYGTIENITINTKEEQYNVIDFPLENIDNARRAILAKTSLNQRVNLNNDINYLPYSINFENDEVEVQNKIFNGLWLKTYQSDIFNNWLNTDNIDLINNISSIAVDEQNGISIDAMILAKKVYNVLNRIAVAGGTYEDWQESVYGENAIRRAESPIYIGGTSGKIKFEEVVSTSQSEVNGVFQPLGNLGGKGGLTDRKGGKIIYKCEEPTIILGIASITPYVDYSQGNNWIVTELDNMDNLHKPELDGIGFQNLIANNVHWAESPTKALAKQTAWIHYQTAIDECFGQFAIPHGEANSLQYMTLQRNYEVDDNGEIQDFTTYIDPAKYNYCFVDDSFTAQNFWIAIAFDIESRRKMAAYEIPNL